MREVPTGLLQPHELASMDRLSAEVAIRARSQSAYLGDHLALARILGRYKFFVDTRDEGFGTHVLLDGFWEIWLTLFLARNVRSGMVVVDVGANFGYYSVMCAEFVGASGAIVSVEPNPAAADLLARSISINGFADRTSVERVALDDQTGRPLLFYVPQSEPKNALVVDTASCVCEESGRLFHVQSATLDHLLADRSRVDLIKIDAEGSEERIFAGMTEVLARHRPTIIMEFNAARYTDPGGFIDRLKGVFGALHAIDFDGIARPVARDHLLATRWGEDWLLVLSQNTPV